MRRRRRWLLMVTVLLGLLVMVAWALRDRPRRLLATALGARLGATVTIGRLELAATDRVRLYDVTVRELASQPWLATLTVTRLEAVGNLQAVAEGRLSALRIHGGLLELQRPTETAIAGEDPLPNIGRLTIRGLRVQLPGQPHGFRHQIAIDGTLTGVGGTALEGDARVRIPVLATAPLARFLGWQAPDAPLAATLPGPSSVDLRLTTDHDQPRLEIDASLPHIRSAHAELQRTPDGEWSIADARIESLAIGPWLLAWPSAGPSQLDFLTGGILDVGLEGQPRRGLTWRATLRDGAGDGIDGSGRSWTVADLHGSLSGVAHREDGGLGKPTWHSSVTGQLDAKQLTLGAERDDISVPFRLLLDGHGRLGARSRVEAVAALSLGRWGHFEVDGTVDAQHIDLEGSGEGELNAWLTRLATWAAPMAAVTTAAGHWRAAGRLEGPWDTAAVAATVTLDDLVLHDDAGRMLDAKRLAIGVEAHLPIASASTAIMPTRFEARAHGLVLALDDQHRLTAAEVEVEVEVEVATDALERRDARLRVRGHLRTHDTKVTWGRGPSADHAHAERTTTDFDLSATDPTGAGASVIEAEITLEGPRGQVGGWRWAGDQAMAISLSGTTARTQWVVAPTVTSVSKVPVPPLSADTTFQALSLTLGGSAVLDTATLRLDPVQADIDAGPLGRGRITGSVGPSRLKLQVSAAEADLAPWLARVDALRDLVPAGSALSGRGRAELDLRAAPDVPWSIAGHVALADGGWTSEDGSRVIQGLPIDAEITLTPTTAPTTESASHATDSPSIALDARAQIGGFQMLWGTVFADYSDHAAVAEITAHWRSGPRGAKTGKAVPTSWQAEIGLRFTDAASTGAPRGRLTLAQAGADGLDYQLQITSDNLDTLLVHDLRAPLQGSVPWLDALEAAGRAEIELAGHWHATRRSVRGSLQVTRGFAAYAGDRFRAEGLDLVLPMDLAWKRGTPSSVAGPPLTGRIRFARLVAGGLGFEPVATELDIVADTVRFAGGLNGPFLGGRLGLGALALVDLMQPSRHVSTGVTLRALDLALAAQRLGLPPLEGNLDGAFPRVRATVDRFEVEGDSTVEVFGGSVRIFDIAGGEIFSRYPRTIFSADFTDIDLEQVTHTFDVGVMTGWVEGELRRCELFRGVPVRCAGRIESVPERRAKRFIDVKAVNNISILGTGGQIGRIDRGLHRFLRRFTYGALGVDIALRDDRFQLRGLLERNERELFLKGRFPFPIDVVNSEPGNTVSFQTMLGRLRNFQVGRETAP